MKKSATAIHTRLLRHVRSMRLYVATMVALSIFVGVLIIMQAHYLAHIVNAVFLDRQGLSQVAIPAARHDCAGGASMGERGHGTEHCLQGQKDAAAATFRSSLEAGASLCERRAEWRAGADPL
jgi:hypothetical protein